MAQGPACRRRAAAVPATADGAGGAMRSFAGTRRPDGRGAPVRGGKTRGERLMRIIGKRRPAAPSGAVRAIAATALAALAIAASSGPEAAAGLAVDGDWPAAPPGGTRAVDVAFPSASPFVPAEAGPDAPPTEAVATYYPPARRSAPGAGDPGDPAGTRPAPGAILLHGAGGVSRAREETYARQLAAQGVGALVIDVFAARRDLARGFVERILEITESMTLADAYAGLAWLAARPEIDPDRIALVGFSYGGLASVSAAYRQSAERFAPDGPRFAAHVSFYGPCIARWDDPATTGAPVLMLWGGRDAIADAEACRAVATDLRRGGSRVRTVVYPEALHRWDGGNEVPWRASRNVADCRFRVSPDGRVRETTTGLAMTGRVTRRLILAACTDEEGFLIGRDETIRRRSNAELARFLNPVLFPADPR